MHCNPKVPENAVGGIIDTPLTALDLLDVAKRDRLLA